MAEITVRDESRPSFHKYVVYTIIGVLLVNGLVVTVVQGARNPAVALGGVALAGIANVGIVFLMVQSLIGEWFDAAEVVEE